MESGTQLDLAFSIGGAVIAHLYRMTLGVLCLLLLAGCADKRITLSYTPDPGLARLSAENAVTVFQFRDSRGSEGDNDSYRVGGIYGGYGNRLSKLMVDTPWQRTLVNALTMGLRARGVRGQGVS
jgi:uncharacterized lipoprotein YajG